jgi:hypothetical protein
VIKATMEPTIWQLSGGPASRTYAGLFLRHGVGLVGPGDPGPWSEVRYDYDWALKGFVGNFASKAQQGDIVLLRTGVSTITAVGILASEYTHETRFDDVNGWDLQHCRRVRWCPLPTEFSFDVPVSKPTRFCRVQNPQVIEFARRFVNSEPKRWQMAELPPLPAEEPILDEVPEPLRELVGQAHDYALLAEDRSQFPEYPSEHEIVGHFVIPFLRMLGWPIELIGIEWRRVDVALFRSLPRLPESCQFVIEAKRFGAGVEGAFDQARAYVEKLGVLRDVVVTDGVRYRLYSASEDFAPAAYANLARLKPSALNLMTTMRRP